ncbi:UNVERIFIED_CONTAM: signal peptidase I [Microbacterium sp. SLM126]
MSGGIVDGYARPQERIVDEEDTAMTDAGTPASPADARDDDDRVSFPRMLFNALSWVLLAAIALLAVVVVVVPLATGAKPYTILTGSMAPQYPPGTLVVVKQVDVAEINLGDVITYQLESGKPEVVTHRVVAVGADAEGEPIFITRGDANDGDDPEPVQPVQIVGKLWYSVPYIGWINNVVTGQARALALPILVGGLFVYGIVTIALGFRDRRREKAALAEGTRGSGATSAEDDPATEQ